MAVRLHKLLAYLFAGLQALAGLFHVAAYADPGKATPAAHAAGPHPAPARSSTAASNTPPAAKRDAYYRAELQVLGDVARVVGKYKLTPPQRLAVMNYIGHSNRGLKIVSFGKSDGVEKFSLKDAKTGTLLGVIGLRITRQGAVVVDKATYAALDYKKYVSLPVKGKPGKKLAAHVLKGSMELPLLESSLKKSKRAVALPGLRPLPGLDFTNARQCTARFNADGSGAEYCLVSKPATRLAKAPAPAATVPGKTAAAPTSAAAAAVPKATISAPASAAPAQRPAPANTAKPVARAPAAPATRTASGDKAAAVAEAALVGAVTYFARPVVNARGREIESGLTSRYRVNDTLPHYEYRYSSPAATLPAKPAAPTQQNITVINQETNVYEEQTDVIEENTTINRQETEIVEVLPPEANAPAGTDFTPVEDAPVVKDDDGIPETGGILPYEEPAEDTGTPADTEAGPEFNPVLNQDDEEPGEGYGIPGLPGVYTGGPSDEEPDALKHDMEEHDYENALDKGTPEAMDTFMKEHPDSEQADYERAVESGDPEKLEQFAEDHPDSEEAEDAATMIELGDNQETPSQFDDQAAPENTAPEEDTPTY